MCLNFISDMRLTVIYPSLKPSNACIEQRKKKFHQNRTRYSVKSALNYVSSFTDRHTQTNKN